MKHLIVSFVVVISLTGCSNEPQEVGPPQAPPPDPPVNVGCVTDSECDDGTFCNGAETCFDGVCLSGEPPCVGIKECDEAEAFCFTPLEAIQSATWLVYTFSDWSFFTATAFGLTDDLFATNAHVTEELKLVFGEPNAQALLFQHETGEQRTITEVWTHPGYDADNLAGTPDTGLLRTEPSGSSPGSFEPLLLADNVVLSNLGVFDEVRLCGFPGNLGSIDLADILEGTGRPRASCLEGTISALRPFDPTDPATPENTVLIQYDLPVGGGTSGSAVFDKQGNIIGVNSFGFVGEGTSNFAIRSDILGELLAWAESGVVASTVLADVELNIPPCQTSYFNLAWQFGFDVPSEFNETTIDPDAASPILFTAEFAKINEPEGLIRVRVFPTNSVDGIYLGVLQFLQGFLSAEIITTEPFITANGVPAYFTIALVPDVDGRNPPDYIHYYYVHTAGVSGVYEFWASTRLSNVPAIGSILEDAALSLCTEWPRTASRSPSSVPHHGSIEWDASHYRDMVGKAAENIQRNLQPADANSEED